MGVGTFGTEFAISPFEILTRRLVCSGGVQRMRKWARIARLARPLSEELAWHMRVVLLGGVALRDQKMLDDHLLLLRRKPLFCALVSMLPSKLLMAFMSLSISSITIATAFRSERKPSFASLVGSLILATPSARTLLRRVVSF